MKRILLSAFGCMAILSAAASSEGSFTKLGSNTIAVSVSPDGHYVAGYSIISTDEFGYTYKNKSFIYDTTTDTTEWLAPYDETDPLSGGLFNYVTNSGIVVGSSYDPENTYFYNNPNTGEDTREPLNVATIWKDGEKILLGYGPYTSSDFKFYGNGSFAVSCNEDASVVNGYIHTGSAYATKACRWYYNPSTDEYEYEELVGIDNPAYYEISSFRASADGSIFVGEAKVGGMLGKRQFLVFDEGGESTIFDPFDINPNGTAWIYDVSPNGKYALFFSYDMSYNMQCGVWDFEKDAISWVIPLPDGHEVLEAAGQSIDDNGCGYIWTDEGDLLYYSLPDRVCIKAADYFDSFESEIRGYTGTRNFVVYDASADGNIIIGNSGSSDMDNLNAWILTLPEDKPFVLNTVGGVNAYYHSPTEVTLCWDRLSVPTGAKLTAYKVAIGTNETVIPVEDLKTAPNGQYFHQGPGYPGAYVGCAVVAIVDYNGKTYESAPATCNLYMQAATNPFFYEDFDNASMNGGNAFYDGSVWTPRETSTVGVTSWCLNYNDYANNTPFFTTMSVAGAPWHSDMITYFCDASDVTDDMYFTFYLIRKNINGAPVSDKDMLSLQWSENGYDWNTLFSVNSSTYDSNKWNFFKIDCNQLRGKKYQLRWHAQGMGQGQVEWRLDYMGMVKDAKTAAPMNVRKHENADGGVDIEWSNSAGAYEFSYLYNHPVVAEQSIGNGGKPLMIGIEMDAAQAQRYVGMQIKTVSSLIYDNPDKQKTPTYMEAVIFEDGKEVARTDFPEVDPNAEFGAVMAVFENPVTIKEGSKYIIAVNIEDYADNAQPLWYQVRQEACVPGKSDLYSENGGKSWEWLSDLYTEEQQQDTYGWAVWPIRVGILPATDNLIANAYDNHLHGYNIYRDGELLNNRCQYFTAPRFFDADGTIGNNYTVEAFYTDGRVSVMSAPAVNNILLPTVDNVAMDVTVVGSDIVVNGNATAVVYNMSGVRVATVNGSDRVRNLPAGVYIVSSEAADGVKAIKVVVK